MVDSDFDQQERPVSQGQQEMLPDKDYAEFEQWFNGGKPEDLDNKPGLYNMVRYFAQEAWLAARAVQKRPPEIVDEHCVECGAGAIGQCEACDAPICPDHESGEYTDVYTCADGDACGRRINAKPRAVQKTEAVPAKQENFYDCDMCGRKILLAALPAPNGEQASARLELFCACGAGLEGEVNPNGHDAVRQVWYDLHDGPEHAPVTREQAARIYREKNGGEKPIEPDWHIR